MCAAAATLLAMLRAMLRSMQLPMRFISVADACCGGGAALGDSGSNFRATASRWLSSSSASLIFFRQGLRRNEQEGYLIVIQAVQPSGDRPSLFRVRLGDGVVEALDEGLRVNVAQLQG